MSEYNVAKLHANGQPVAMIKAVHSGPGASKVSADDAGGLEPMVCLAQGARVMLTANLWVQAGLVNGAMGTVVAICYGEARGSPPNLPIAVTVRFDSYCGPTLPDGTVPIIPLLRTWLFTEKQCSRLQLPLKLVWAVTIHKCQGMTLNKAVIDVGKKEFSAGLTFVTCSRVRQLKDLLFVPPFPFQRVANLAKSHRHTERLREEKRLQGLNSKQLSGKMAQPIVETEIVAVEADGAKTKPNVPMCEALGQVICNASIVASPVVRPANQKSPDMPDIPNAQAKAVDVTGELEITRVELNTSQFRYYSGNVEWQQRICEELQLEYCGPNGIASGSPSSPLINPIGFKNIHGDGNCMFRVFSFIITGSEDQHMQVHHAIIRHMRVINSALWESQISSLLRNLRHIGEVPGDNSQSSGTEFTTGGIDRYIAATGMDHDKTWGFEVEIMVLSHLLNAAVYTYDTNSGWSKYIPANVYGQFNVSSHVGSLMTMYVRHNVNHYDIVTSVQ